MVSVLDWWRKIVRDFNTPPVAVESHNPKPAPVTCSVCERCGCRLPGLRGNDVDLGLCDRCEHEYTPDWPPHAS